MLFVGIVRSVGLCSVPDAATPYNQLFEFEVSHVVTFGAYISLISEQLQNMLFNASVPMEVTSSSLGADVSDVQP